MGSVMLTTPISGLRKRIFRRASSNVHSTVSPARRPRTTRTYSSMSASFTGRIPIVRLAVKPVETPKSMRPGASALRLASHQAATAAVALPGRLRALGGLGGHVGAPHVMVQREGQGQELTEGDRLPEPLRSAEVDGRVRSRELRELLAAAPARRARLGTLGHQ